MIVKEILTLLAVLLTACYCKAETLYLVIERDESNSIEVDLKNLPILVFEDNDLSIKWMNNAVNFPYSSISNFKYSAYSGINDIDANNNAPIVTGDCLRVKKPSSIEVFQSNGVRIFMDSGFMGELQFSQFPKGFLIISIDSQKVKILNNKAK